MYFKIIIVKNTTFFSILLIICAILSPLKSLEKTIGSPYVQKIALHNYGFKNNNLSIIQDSKGILYIGNTNGIVQFDGTNWKILKIKGLPYLDIDQKGKIYVGTYNEIGFIDNSSGRAKYKSLINDPGREFAKFGQINQVFVNGSEVYFCSDSVLLKYDGEKIHILDKNESKLKIFKVNDQIYLKKDGLGLFKLINQEFKLIPHSSFFLNKTILDILPFHQQLLIKTAEDKGFFIFDNDTVFPFITKADEFILEKRYSSACVLRDGSFAVGTNLGGIIVIDKNGEILTRIDESSNLFSLNINHLFTDKSNNLWALHDQGMSRIEVPSPFTYFNKNHGVRGNVNSVIRFKNKLYVATSLGLYYLDKSTDCIDCSDFKAINEIRSDCYDFHLFKDRLFLSTSAGIYEIINSDAIVFYNRHAKEITCVLQSTKNSAYIYLGHQNGFSAIRYVGRILIVEKKLAGINDKINSIAENENGSLWLSSNENGLYRIKPFEKYSPDLNFEHYPLSRLSDQIDWINLYTIKNDVLFSTSQGVYRFNPTKNEFYIDTLLGVDFSKENSWVFPIIQDQKQNIWLNVIGTKNSRNKTLIKNVVNDSLRTFRPLPLNRIKDFVITSIHPDENGIVWFGGFEGLIRLDMNMKPEIKIKHSVVIHQISLGNDSLLYQELMGSPENNSKKYRISYRYNTLNFNFSSTDFESEDQSLYRYKLEGFDSTWSNWTNLNFKEYTNLYEGKYTFRVVSKNIFDLQSEEVVVDFYIKPPFYRSHIAFFLYVVTSLLFFILIDKWRAFYFARERFRLENIIHERTEEVVIQKEKADNLLERVLPKTTAQELKSGRKAGPYHYNMVTVLFSDIQGFTKIAEQMDSEHLIDELDRFFLQFDTVVEKYNIEKIKTIGDAYMCAGGIPIKNRTNPVEVVLAALEMQNFMKDLKRTTEKSTQHVWDLRIGIDTGPVVAGVLGRSKISYDIWGGTVNTASRMEASGEPGKINITENTYMLIKDYFICQYRGKMPVKYKGEIDMYFVEGLKPHLASDLKGHIPNQNLYTQLQLLRVNDVEEFVLSKLEDGLPDNLYYHNVKHTIDVVTQVELIGRSEKVSDEDMLILKTAAVFHDVGHLVNYDTHEQESIKLAKQILPEYHYNQAQIERICNLIVTTQMPPQPKNLLEAIMCDADLDYLGRTDFVPVSINLYKELAERKKIDSILEWNQMQLKFIKNHQYFTQTAQKLREVNKKNQLENIQNEINRELGLNDK